MAIANKVENIPNNWEENKMAGYDWAKLFLKRHNDILLVRTLEATSIQRMACFNEHNVAAFMDNLENALMLVDTQKQQAG